MTALGHENVGGLDVAMDDAVGVSSIERVCYLNSDIDQAIGFNRTASNKVLEGDAIQVLHSDEPLIIQVSDFVYSANVWMIQSRGGASFPSEAL
jgi:hypothetical protein